MCKQVTSVGISRPNVRLEETETEALTATVVPSDASNKGVTWTSSKPDIATVSTSGLVCAKKIGSTIVKVTTKEGGFSQTCNVTVIKKSVHVTGISIANSSLTLKEKEEFVLTATVTPSNATDKDVIWKSSCTDIATVSSDGRVYAKTVGTVNITAMTNDGGYSKSCKITVEKKPIMVTGIDLSPISLSLKVTESKLLTACALPSNASNKALKWTSNKTAVATVSPGGVVCAKAVGTATITVKTSDGGWTKTCIVKVESSTVPVTGVDLSKTQLSIEVDEAYLLTKCIAPSNASNKIVMWTSSNPDVATVSSGGLICAKAVGSTNITVKTNDGNYSKTCKLTVTGKGTINKVAVTGITIKGLEDTYHLLKMNEKPTLKAVLSPSNATNKEVRWSSSDKTVVTVNESGNLCPQREGEAIITSRTVDGNKTATYLLKVIPSVLIEEIQINKVCKDNNTIYLEAVVIPEDATGEVEWSGRTLSEDGTEITGETFSLSEANSGVAADMTSGATGAMLGVIAKAKTQTKDVIKFVNENEPITPNDIIALMSSFVKIKSMDVIKSKATDYIRAYEAVKTAELIGTEIVIAAAKVALAAAEVGLKVANSIILGNDSQMKIVPNNETLLAGQTVTISTMPTVNAQWTVSSNIANLSSSSGSSVTLTTDGKSSGIVTVTAKANGESRTCTVFVLKKPEEEGHKGKVIPQTNIRYEPRKDANDENVTMVTPRDFVIVDVNGSIEGTDKKTWYYITWGGKKGYVRYDRIDIDTKDPLEKLKNNSDSYKSDEELNRLSNSIENDTLIVARMFYAEDRGSGKEAMEAHAWVLVNRKNDSGDNYGVPSNKTKTYRNLCILDPDQFAVYLGVPTERKQWGYAVDVAYHLVNEELDKIPKHGITIQTFTQATHEYCDYKVTDLATKEDLRLYNDLNDEPNLNSPIMFGTTLIGLPTKISNNIEVLHFCDSDNPNKVPMGGKTYWKVNYPYEYESKKVKWYYGVWIDGSRLAKRSIDETKDKTNYVRYAIIRVGETTFFKQ